MELNRHDLSFLSSTEWGLLLIRTVKSSTFSKPADKLCSTPSTFVAFLIRPAQAPVYPKTDQRRRVHTASASARRLCPRLCLRFPSLCRTISTLLHLGSVADFSLSADLAVTAFTADLIRFAEPLLSITQPLNLTTAETLTYTARTTFHTDRTSSLPVTRGHYPIRLVQPSIRTVQPHLTAMDPNQERRTKHAHAKRPRSSPTRRPPQPPPQPAPEPYDSDFEQTLSGEHTDCANHFEERYFTILARRMYDNFMSMQKKTVENTQRVDLETLRKLGVEQQFLHLTSRVGISPEFWTRGDNYYEMDIREFLSSLQLKWDANDIRYIKFCLCNTTQRVYLSSLRCWFGFHGEPTTDTLSFREGWDRDILWEKITGNPKKPKMMLNVHVLFLTLFSASSSEPLLVPSLHAVRHSTAAIRSTLC